MTLGELLLIALFGYLAIWLLVNRETRQIIIFVVVTVAAMAVLLWAFTVRLW